MKRQYALCSIGMRDIQGLREAQLKIDAVHDAIAATCMQAKPATMRLLRKAIGLVERVIQRAAPRALQAGAAGAYFRTLDVSPELVQYLLALAPQSAPASEETA